MFVGHYGPSLGLRHASGGVPLWVLFLAARFVDIVWSVLVITGVEKVESAYPETGRFAALAECASGGAAVRSLQARRARWAGLASAWPAQSSQRRSRPGPGLSTTPAFSPSALRQHSNFAKEVPLVPVRQTSSPTIRSASAPATSDPPAFTEFLISMTERFAEDPPCARRASQPSNPTQVGATPPRLHSRPTRHFNIGEPADPRESRFDMERFCGGPAARFLLRGRRPSLKDY